jgi:hypothetical protein
LFWNGLADINSPRERKVSTAEYFKHLCMLSTPRFRTNKRLLYMGTNLVLKRRGDGAVRAVIHSTPGVDDITVDDLKYMAQVNDDRLPKIVQRFCNRIPNSPAFWNNTYYKLVDMVEQLGVPTVFLTLSCADSHWPDVHDFIGKSRNPNYVPRDYLSTSATPFEEMAADRRRAAVDHPFETDFALHNRAMAYIRHVLVPYLNVHHFFCKDEYQERGMLHFHMLLWLDLPTGQPQDICGFIRRILSGDHECMTEDTPAEAMQTLAANTLALSETLSSTMNWNNQIENGKYPSPSDVTKRTLLVNPTMDPQFAKLELRELHTHVQHHQCVSTYCRRTVQRAASKGGNYDVCRFRYPKKLCEKSVVHLNDDGEFEIELRRNDARINKFHPLLQYTWRANMDIQFIHSNRQLNHYFCPYVTKADKASSVMASVLQQLDGKEYADPARVMLHKLVGPHLRTRDVSAAEASHILMESPFAITSEQFVILDLQEGKTLDCKRAHFDARAQQPQLEHDGEQNQTALPTAAEAAQDDDIHLGTASETCMQQYLNRKERDISLYQWVVKSFATNRKTQRAPIVRVFPAAPKVAIEVLSNGQAVIDSDEKRRFCHYQCVLHVPFFSRDTLDPASFDDAEHPGFQFTTAHFQQLLQDDLTTLRRPSQSGLESIKQRLLNIEKAVRGARGGDPETDGDDALEADPESEDDIIPLIPDPGREFNVDGRDDWMTLAGDDLGRCPADPTEEALEPLFEGDPTRPLFHWSIEIEEELEQLQCDDAQETLQAMLEEFVAPTRQPVPFEELGKEQQFAAQDVITTMQRCGPTPVRAIVTGGAGCGKSRLINFLKDHFGNACQVLAFTGSAANNVSGTTIHSGLGLRPRKAEVDDATGDTLAAESVNIKSANLSALQQTWLECRLLIVDEYSMVGLQLLSDMDSKLRELRCRQDEIFGGLNVLLIGDIAQLPPVLMTPPRLYHSNKADLVGAARLGLFVLEHFDKVYDLQEVFRTDNDQEELREVQRLLRVGDYQPKCYQVLQRRFESIGTKASDDNFSDAKFLLPTRAGVRDANLHAMQTTASRINSPVVSLPAIIKFIRKGVAATDKQDDIETVLHMYVNAPVMLISNLHIPSGLFNGSEGTVVWFYRNDEDCVDIIIVQFDERYTGPSCLHTLPRCVPVGRLNQTTAQRRVAQFPLKLLHASTIHKAQGRTLRRAIIDLGASDFTDHLSYTALTRVRRLDDMILKAFPAERLHYRKGNHGDQGNRKRKKGTASTMDSHECFLSELIRLKKCALTLRIERNFRVQELETDIEYLHALLQRCQKVPAAYVEPSAAEAARIRTSTSRRSGRATKSTQSQEYSYDDT